MYKDVTGCNYIQGHWYMKLKAPIQKTCDANKTKSNARA